MAEETRQRNLSLIPYQPAESREVVLRHGSSVVVFDQDSRQLSLRDASRSDAIEPANCPYCHRPLHDDDNVEKDFEPGNASLGGSNEAGFVNPGYFKLLGRSLPGSRDASRPPSPRRRLGQNRVVPVPEIVVGDGGQDLDPPSGAEFIGSAPVPEATGSTHGISSSAFSPNYFKTFFVEEGELGRGGKGVVLLVRHMLDGVSLGHFACKRVPVGDDHEWLEKVLLEVQLLQNLSHQNLVSYRHVWLEDYQITKFGPSVPCAFILQQYCNGGDLLKFVLGATKSAVTAQEMKARMRRRSKGKLEEPEDVKSRAKMHFDEIFSFTKDITSGLHHLHSNGYIHRDLKPSNCLLHRAGKDLRVLVSDFGEVQAANAKRHSTGTTGTISYCAPEVLQQETPGGAFGNFSTKSDIFSLGMIVYFMCFRQLPYRHADTIEDMDEDIDSLRAEIATWAGFEDEVKIRSDLPDDLYKFLKRLLAINPADRPSTDDILQGIRGGHGIGDRTPSPHKNHFQHTGVSSRISSADTPSASPTRYSLRSTGITGGRVHPGPSKLRHSAMDGSISPPAAQSDKSGSSYDDASSRSAGSPTANHHRINSAATTALNTSVVLRPRKSHPSSPQSASTSPQHEIRQPRLILPPPPSRFISLRRSATHPTTTQIIRISLFIIKILSLFQVCVPFAARGSIVHPLLLVAILDLLTGFGLLSGSRRGWVWRMDASDRRGDIIMRRSDVVPQIIGSVTCLMVHCVVLGWAIRSQTLCLHSSEPSLAYSPVFQKDWVWLPGWMDADA